MKKLDYLKLALNNDLPFINAWVISAFAITKIRPTSPEGGGWYFGEIIRTEFGYSFVNEQAVLETIDGVNKDEPLFTFKERLDVDETWAPNIKGKVNTSIGNLIFNKIVILSSFGPKFEYTLGKVNIPKLENIIAAKLKDTPRGDEERSNSFYYVDEYVRFRDALQNLSQFSQLCTYAATIKNVRPPDGIKEFKTNLNIKYEGKLKNPIELAKYEKELRNFDDEFLKDDPSGDTFLDGKIRNVSRKKMFLSIGAETGFEDEIKLVPVTNSLSEGWPTDSEQYVAMMNSIRSGSFSRGVETVKGGVSAKLLLRSANDYKILENDCGTKLGIRRTYTEKNIHKLVGRKVFIDNNTTRIDSIETARKYLNTPLVVRSPMYCKSPGQTICEQCSSDALSQYKTGVTIPLTEISAIILATSMKKMHSAELQVTELKLSEVLT